MIPSSHHVLIFNISAVYIMRGDSFLDYLLEEEESFFVKRNKLSANLRAVASSIQKEIPVSYEMKTAYYVCSISKL